MKTSRSIRKGSRPKLWGSNVYICLGSRIHVQDPRSYCKIMCRSLIIVKRGAGLEINDALVEPSGDSLTSAGLSFVAKILIIVVFLSLSSDYQLPNVVLFSPAHHLSHGNILQDKEDSWCHVGPGDSSRSCSGLSHCLMFCCCLQFVCCCFIEILKACFKL